MSRGAILAIALAILAVGFGAWWFVRSLEIGMSGASQQSTIVVPRLSAEAEAGQDLFKANCATCHGPKAGGTDRGPPLVHKIYEPGHHGDLAFQAAVQNGVRAHHWRFGDMPPVPDVSVAEVAEIVSYVRALQRANGIE